jgi:excisionase family DNA binding protein
MPEILRHVTLALAGHLHRLHQRAVPVPREVEELTVFLMRLARIRQDSPTVGDDLGAAHHADSPDRLLVTKGEAAERLGVSVRTIERLVATGRLPQVNVERLARFRVSDLGAYVNGLTECHNPDTNGAGTTMDGSSHRHSRS